jgi:hypothetical protein
MLVMGIEMVPETSVLKLLGLIAQEGAYNPTIKTHSAHAGLLWKGS